VNTILRKAQADDATAAWEIRNAAIRYGCKEHYSAELLAIWTAGKITPRFAQLVADQFYVATINEEAVGTGIINLSNGQLDAIFVRPNTMRRGIGKLIVGFLENLALEAGLTELTLDSTLNAAPFYRQCGFVGETVGKYESPRGISLDCIPMTKQLPASTTIR
jgi:GNAT superfamily N-acetyltransferase